MNDVHIRLPEITALIMAVSALITALCGGIATVLGAVNHRQLKHVRDAQGRLETAVNGRVEELANAKAGQAILQAAIDSAGGRVIVQSASAQEETTHVG